MTNTQLYVDGVMTGPSHGPGIPPARLPSPDVASKTARVVRGSRTIAQLRVVGGREQVRHIPGVWVWRDTIQEGEWMEENWCYAPDHAVSVTTGKRARI